MADNPAEKMAEVSTKMRSTYNRIATHLRLTRNGNLDQTEALVGLVLGLAPRTSKEYFKQFIKSGVIRLTNHGQDWKYNGMDKNQLKLLEESDNGEDCLEASRRTAHEDEQQ